MIKKLYNWIYKFTSDPEDKGEYSSGYWQGLIRKKTLGLCGDIRGRILEVGTGSGLFVTRLARQNTTSQIWSIDNDPEKLNYAANKIRQKSLTNIDLSCQNAKALSFDNEYFDAVVCINFILMLDSFETVAQVLTQMKRVCKTSGKIIFEFRNKMNPFFVIKYKLARCYDDTLKDNALKCYDPKEIESILNALNLKILRKIYVGAFLFKSFAPIIIIEAGKE